MYELEPGNAAAYLVSRMAPDPGSEWRVRPLGGGVSNSVFLAESGSRRLVIKQALGALRVDEEWLAARTRIHRESAALRMLAPALPAGAVPEVVFEDAENFVYAMEAAPEGTKDWKSLLLAGQVDEQVADDAARVLAGLIRCSWHDEGWLAEFGDQTSFEQLRLDPYYRFTAAKHPDLEDRFDERIEFCRRNRVSLVHGDYSPKNVLVTRPGVMVIDFEVIHVGDPGFDVAFLVNHLLLKAVHLPALRERLRDAAVRFWRTLAHALPEAAEWLEESAMLHLGCLHLARADGKSPAEYLTPGERETVRRNGRDLIVDPPGTVEDAFFRLSI